MKNILLPFLASLFLAVSAVHAAQPASPAVTTAAKSAIAIFAGGCFWCMEADFEKLPGVISAESGYTGGTVKDPDYEQVSAGGTGHAESVLVTYDSSRVSYEKLLDWYWHHIDPVTANAQFCDHGTQYRSAIFYLNETQHAAAEQSRQLIEKSGVLKKPIVTEIVAAGPFYPAEGYHQDYYKKNPVRYNYYRYGCGRDQRVQEVWGTKH